MKKSSRFSESLATPLPFAKRVPIINYSVFIIINLIYLCICGCTLPKRIFIFNKKHSLKTVAIVQPLPASKPGELKKFNAIIHPDAKIDSGLLNVYRQDGRYFFELADTLFGRDIMMVSRITRSAAELRNPQAMLGYGGDEINENVVRFERGPDLKIFLRSISFGERGGDSTQIMYKSVANSNIQPIVASFDAKASGKKAGSIIIDMTDLLNGDNDLLFFDNGVKAGLKLVQYQGDKSYINEVRSYPNNVEIKTVKTYLKAPVAANLPPAGLATFELNSSWVLLPKQLMKPRIADARVGYLNQGYTDFNINPQGVERQNIITRWRLEPRPEDIKRYLAGELVEPLKSIIFYIDPATPKKWVPYLIQGVNDWQKAFEQAGFKNAIIAKEAPVNDPTWSLEDASHNAIIYKPSDIANASGPHVHDPRTGEILETHINWYHNIMSLLHNWYMIQAGAIDPRARKIQLDDELMGELIRFVSSHEVGHTLGLRHNFGASSTVPVDSLRNKIWVETHGHTPSIMDYARFNYVAQPEDHISEAGIFPRIGEYDKWAIEYGYRWYPEENKTQLNQWVIDKTSHNKHLWFGSETDADDPRDQSEALGDDDMKAGAYGIKNLQRILPQLAEWTKVPNENFDHLSELYRELLGQYGVYIDHACKYIGGIYTSPKSIEEGGLVKEYVSKAKQQEALKFLLIQLFDTPAWLLNPVVFNMTGNGSIATIYRQQDAALSKIVSPYTLYKLLQAEGRLGKDSYTVAELFSDLETGIFKELGQHQTISIYRRNLQKLYVDKLAALLKPTSSGTGMPDIAQTDIPSLSSAHLLMLQTKIKYAVGWMKDSESRAHLKDLEYRISILFKSSKALS
jgi:hypothetical protein